MKAWRKSAGTSRQVCLNSLLFIQCQSMGVIRRLDAKARTGLLFAPWLIKAPDVVAAAHEQGANAIHPYVLNTLDGLIREAHEAGLAVAPWTVDLSVLVRHFAVSGIETIISNDPRMAAEAIASAQEK